MPLPGRYQRVSGNDDDDELEYSRPMPTRRPQPQRTPNSPPPSFHSRQSSRDRANGNNVNSTLADAFDADGDDSDDEADDTQRLVRGNSFPNEPPYSSSPNNSTAATNTPGSSTPQVHPTGARIFGGGTANEGVFSNLMAKPERGGEEKDEMPPTYEQAAADAAPPYWETTILAPGFGGGDEVFIDGMPVGSFFSFVWNAMISMSFQLVGFLLTYLLHSTHAAKNGSRAGLGVTLIQYGFYLRAGGVEGDQPPQMGGENGYAAPEDPNSHDFKSGDVTGGGGSIGDISGSEWMSYLLMIVGWFILIRSISSYLQARRHEQLVMQSPDRGLPVPIIATGESTERVV